jgi:methylphosphotriester-DNA--protein-cysteine methyltransferase
MARRSFFVEESAVFESSRSTGHLVSQAQRLFAKEADRRLKPLGLSSGYIPVILALAVVALPSIAKSLTGMTPLDYQKQLRLLEARHLLSSGEHKAEAVAQRVGYQSASQFSREYARNFGLPPKRDIAALARQGRTAAVNGLRPS